MTEMSNETVATRPIHSSTLVFLFEVLGLGLSEPAGSGEPGGSVGGLGAFSTSGSGFRGMVSPLETPDNNKTIKVDRIFPPGCSEKLFCIININICMTRNFKCPVVVINAISK